jgi:hypothetical protein
MIDKFIILRVAKITTIIKLVKQRLVLSEIH